MKVSINLDDLKSENGTYSETTAKAVEHLTGKSFSDVINEAEAKPDIPDGNPGSWDTKTKLKFIEEHGRKAFQRALKND